MNPGHGLGLGIHEILSGSRATDESNVNLNTKSIPNGVRNEKAHSHKLQIKEDRRKHAPTMPVLVQNWNLNARIQSALAHSSDFLTKFSLSDFWFKEVSFGGAEDGCAVVTDPCCAGVYRWALRPLIKDSKWILNSRKLIKLTCRRSRLWAKASCWNFAWRRLRISLSWPCNLLLSFSNLSDGSYYLPTSISKRPSPKYI